MQKSNIVHTIKKRRSIRSYMSEPIPEQDLYEMLSAGLYAPSGKNRQPWRFVIIKEKDKIVEISKLTTYSRFLRNAPVLILVYGRFDDSYPKEKDLISIGCCVQNISLAATCMGYGSCVIGELYGRKIECIEPVESTQGQLVCGICIGIPKSEKWSMAD